MIPIDKKDRPVSPRSGAPLPIGQPFEPGIKAREAGRNGGKKSVEVRRKRRALREEFEMLLSGDITDKKGKKMNAQTAMATAIMYKAIGGDVRAFMAIKETLGDSLAQGNELLQSLYDLERGSGE